MITLGNSKVNCSWHVFLRHSVVYALVVTG